MRANIRKLAERYQKLPVTVKASIWFLFCSFLQKGIAVITTPIFTRLLTSGEYGLYNVFESWRGIIGAFVTLSLAGGMFIQGLVKFERERNVFVSSLQGLGLTLCLVWFGIYLFFKDFWNGLFSLSTVQMTAIIVYISYGIVSDMSGAERREKPKRKQCCNTKNGGVQLRFRMETSPDSQCARMCPVVRQGATA